MFGPFRLPAVGAFFFSAWILMVFWGMVAVQVGFVTIGYPLAMLVTIGSWLALFPITWVRPYSSGNRSWARRPGWRHSHAQAAGSDVNISAVLGAASRRISSAAFKGGNVHTFFGGAQIDLRGATVSDPPAVLNVDAVVGGVEIRVPESWRIQLNVSGALGGSSDERQGVDRVGDGPPDLIVNGTFFLGGLTIKD